MTDMLDWRGPAKSCIYHQGIMYKTHLSKHTHRPIQVSWYLQRLLLRSVHWPATLSKASLLPARKDTRFPNSTVWCAVTLLGQTVPSGCCTILPTDNVIWVNSSEEHAPVVILNSWLNSGIKIKKLTKHVKKRIYSHDTVSSAFRLSPKFIENYRSPTKNSPLNSQIITKVNSNTASRGFCIEISLNVVCVLTLHTRKQSANTIFVATV